MDKVALITGGGRGIAWLLSDEASYVTGTFVDLAGGR
jgi:NAD(P)-dependent dehydrogenase (short-subunit alcohol dehydrogenase family)